MGRGDDRLAARRPAASRRSIRSSWVVASMPVTGSSSRNRSGSAASARARNTRRRWPPDSAPDLRPQVRRPCRPARARRATARRSSRPGPADRPEAREAAHHHHVLDRDRERPVHELRLRDVGDAPGLAARRAPPRISIRPDHGLSSPAISLSSVLLPAPLGPTTASRLPGLDGDRSRARAPTRSP